ncbi:hypothetical protein LCGC14_0821410, partial [marine sediment metagenome]
ESEAHVKRLEAEATQTKTNSQPAPTTVAGAGGGGTGAKPDDVLRSPSATPAEKEEAFKAKHGVDINKLVPSR